MNGRTYCFFLGANSPSGFFSYYDDLIDLGRASAVYVIKGGPGTGKSGFMRRVARVLTERGLECEYILCSSDPDSLDGAIFPEIGVAFVDGTSPHVVEPQYAYAVERYLHTGAFVDTEALEPLRGDIVAATDAYRSFYAGAYRCIRAAGEIERSINRAVVTADASARAIRRAQGIARREFGTKAASAPGREKRRFLTANSPKGVMTLEATVPALASKVYEIQPAYGLGSEMLHTLRAAALRAGFDVISCFAPLDPDGTLAHLFVPELGLAFTTCAGAVADPYRRIHPEGYLDRDLLAANKQKLKFLRRTRDALMEDAVADLAEAKRRHDGLEALYHDAVDFDGLTQFADELAESIIKKYL